MRKAVSIFSLLLSVMIFSTCSKEIGPLHDTSCDSVDNTYLTGIRPILDSNCAVPGCHESGFLPGDYTSYTGIKAKADAGSLENRLFILGDMPPATFPQYALTPEELQQFRCWINAGAPNN